MPAPTLEQLTTPLTRAEALESIYSTLSALGVNTTRWKPGSAVRTTITAVSIVLAAFSKLQADIAKSGFLELSVGPWLTLVAWHLYKVERGLATFATGEITLTNSGGGVYAFDPGDLIFSDPSTGKAFRNTEAFSLRAFATATTSIRATDEGRAGGAAAGAITSLTTPPLTGVTCTNALALFGRDEEPDPALRSRCSEKLGSLSPLGPGDAYVYAARSATRPDRSSIGVNRARITKDGSGSVFVCLASDSGAVPGTVGDLSTDLGIADAAIQRFATPEAVTAVVSSVTAVTVAVTYEIWMYNTLGRTRAEVETAVEARLRAFVNAQPIGGNVIAPAAGKLFVDAIRATIAATFPEIFHVVVTAPTGDTTLTGTEVCALAGVTCTDVHQLAPSDEFGGAIAL